MTHTRLITADVPNGGALDLDAVKARQRDTWASGDYAVVGTTLQIVGETLCEAVDLCADERVLDVAAGNGNATLAAARRFANVISTDYVDALLERGRERAAAERLPVAFRYADAEALPFGDDVFDVVLSTFGVMFAPDQPRAAAEMTRVVRAGGRIGLASWTPDGFIGRLFATIGRHVPPAVGLAPPSLWGTEARLRELFPACQVRVSRRTFHFRYKSPDHWLRVFKTYYGPMHRALASLDASGRAFLEADILALLAGMNCGGPQTLVVPSDYLEAVITKA